MTYVFEPRTDEQFKQQIEERRREMLLQDGEYDFTVKDAKQMTSQSGNEMFKLFLEVYDKKGKPRLMFDHILLNGNWDFKIKKLCDTLDISDLYKSGKLEADYFINKSGFAKICQENDRKMGWQNKIESYLIKSKDVISTDQIIDDDLPF
jgi:hypothetical protein